MREKWSKMMSKLPHIKSRWEHPIGMACFWIGVGVVYPIRSMFARRNLDARVGRVGDGWIRRRGQLLARLETNCNQNAHVGSLLRREGGDAGKGIELRNTVGIRAAPLDLDRIVLLKLDTGDHCLGFKRRCEGPGAALASAPRLRG